MLNLFANPKKVNIEKEIELIQEGDHGLRDLLLQAYKPFIKKCVSKVCKRYVTEGDDEFSIGLIAFNNAMDQYSLERGSSFLAFADLIIRRRVIDYIRSNSKVKTVPIEEEDWDDEKAQSSVLSNLSVQEYERKKEEKARKSEIIVLSEILTEYDCTFQDIVEQSPKHQDAKINAMQVAQTLVKESNLLKELSVKKKLPVKELTKIVKVSRKTIERNRNYIIAITIILSGDFTYLKNYIKEVAEQ